MGNILKSQNISNQPNRKFDQKTKEENENIHILGNSDNIMQENLFLPNIETKNIIRSNKIEDKSINFCMNCKQICVGFEAYKTHFFDKHVSKIRKVVI